MPIKYHHDLIQHSQEWKDARCGLLTASEMDGIITAKTLKVANNKDSRAHLTELLAQRVNNFVEPTWFGGDMERGVIDEIDARNLYRERYAAVDECGFITNDKWGFTLGYLPDGLVEVQAGIEEFAGQIEVKSRSQKHQMKTILDNEMPDDFLIQVQTGMLVTERPWCDFISYSSGMPMFTKRIYADKRVQDAIIEAATEFHATLDENLKVYQHRLEDRSLRLIPTERKIIDNELQE